MLIPVREISISVSWRFSTLFMSVKNWYEIDGITHTVWNAHLPTRSTRVWVSVTAVWVQRNLLWTIFFCSSIRISECVNVPLYGRMLSNECHSNDGQKDHKDSFELFNKVENLEAFLWVPNLTGSGEYFYLNLLNKIFMIFMHRIIHRMRWVKSLLTKKDTS